MDRWRQDTKDWLSNEQAAPEDVADAADAAFAQVFSALQSVEPTPEFVHRTVATAWATRPQRSRPAFFLRAAAMLALATVSSLLSYSLAVTSGPTVVTTAAVFSSRMVFWAVSLAAAALDWWAVTARVSTSLTAMAATPDGVTALVIIQLIAAAALYALRRLLTGAAAPRTPRAFCF